MAVSKNPKVIRRREKRDVLVVQLIEAGCVMSDISWYLGISHGTVSNIAARYNTAHTRRRHRGRPSEGTPISPLPVDVMPEGYIPDYYNDDANDVTAFKVRLARPRPKRRTRAADAQIHTHEVAVPAEDLLEIEPLVPPTTQPSPAEVVAGRISKPEPAPDLEDEPIMY